MEKSTPEEMREATIAVIDRMVVAGWVSQAARSGDIATGALTPEGEQVIRALRRFLSLNGGKMSSNELFSLLALITRSTFAFLDRPA